jgi:hypothetical protein
MASRRTRREATRQLRREPEQAEPGEPHAHPEPKNQNRREHGDRNRGEQAADERDPLEHVQDAAEVRPRILKKAYEAGAAPVPVVKLVVVVSHRLLSSVSGRTAHGGQAGEPGEPSKALHTPMRFSRPFLNRGTVRIS